MSGIDQYKVLRWGVAGLGKITQDFVGSVQSDTGEKLHEFIAAASSRSVESAAKFAKFHQIPKWYGSYEELAKDHKVQVVYVGNLNVDHYSTAKLFLQHGKHVLLEKPLTLNEKQSKSLIKFATEKNLFLMEAVWSRFLPSYEFVMKQIKKGTIGEVRHVSAHFGVQIADIDRVAKKEHGGGTILDIGVYTINLIQQVFGNDYPEKILAMGNRNEEGVDRNVSASLGYSNGRMATFSTHSEVQLVNEAQIVGTKGYIKLLPFFHCCQKVVVNDTEHDFTLPPTKVPMKFEGSSGLRYEAHEVRRVLLAGKVESDRMPHRDSIKIARIQDEIRRQIGVEFDADNLNYD